MNRYLHSALVAAVGVASITCALAQEPTSPPSPRDSTTTQTPPPRSTEPSTTTSPSQRQAAAGTSKESKKQMMKDCEAKERANNTGLSAAQARKNCKAQMSSHTSEPKSY